MSKKRIIFFGFGDVGGKCLKVLLNDPDSELVAIFTHDTDPHEKEWFETPEFIAKERNIPIFKPASLKALEWVKIVEDLNCDLILSLFYRNRIPLSIFSQAKLGAYNMHGSYLPTYRGRAPLNWAIINGEDFGGVSLHVLEEDFDTGDIVAQEKVMFGKDEYVGSIQPKITQAAVNVLKTSLPMLLSGKPHLTKQDASLATYFGKRTPEDGKLDFSKSARSQFNMVRALSHPFPGAWTSDLFSAKTIVWQAKVLDLESAFKETGIKKEILEKSKPAAIVSKTPLLVRCADDFLLIENCEDVKV